MKALKWIFIATIVLLASQKAYTQSTATTNRFVYNSDTQTPVQLNDSKYVGFNLQSQEVDLGSTIVLTLGIDHNCPTYFADNKQFEVILKVTTDQPIDGNLVNYVPLTVKYTPNDDQDNFSDRAIKILEGAHNATVEIFSIIENTQSVNTLQRNVFVDITSYPNTFVPITSAAVSNVLINPVYIDECSASDIDASIDAYQVTWGEITGAVEYQLEWTFINDYSIEFGEYLASSDPSLSFDFKHNSTRVSTTSTVFEIPNLFDHGYLLVRVRALGYASANATRIVPGNWSIANDSGTISSLGTNTTGVILNEDVHQSNLNWQVTTTFAEEGKKKEVISYFDGGYRNRQTVTQINTDEKIIVGETVYDYQGRPVINILPVPVADPAAVCTPQGQQAPSVLNNTLGFKVDFNKSVSGEALKAADFDEDGEQNCEIVAPVLSDDSGASLYYSENNPDKSGEQAYVPDANGYPYTQVEYMPDNTGRIRRQSGVGESFKLGDGTDVSHETKYLYGKPFQIELDRLFASEVGVADHYKKNAVVDPNGQVSVSYMDQEGRVVATALVGEAPSNLEELTSLPAAETELTVDMFNEDINGVSVSNMVVPTNSSIEFSSTFIVPYTTEYEFKYDLEVSTLQLDCTPENMCTYCVYDLEIHLKDACGEELWIEDGNPLIKTVGHLSIEDGNFVFKSNCTEPSTEYSGELIITLEQGTYQISKVLRVNEEARTFYLEQYLDETSNGCMTSLAEFIDEEAGNYDPDDCDIDCESCLADLGSADDYIAAGFGTQADWEAAYAICAALCEFYEPCEAPFNMMCHDMSPGGQYATFTVAYNTDGTAVYSATNDAGHRLSILNTDNLLSANRPTYGEAHWRLPLLHTTSGDVSEYRDENNQRTKVYIVLNEDGSYTPPVVNSALVFEDVVGSQPVDPGMELEFPEVSDVETTVLFTYPENLANLGDFIANWNLGWAKSLVKYHPEYCYYENCLELDHDVASNAWSSAKFDSLMVSDVTRAQAMASSGTLKLLSSTGDVLDWFNVSTTEAYDEFVTNSSTYLDYGLVLQQKFDQYYFTGLTWWSMPQMAAFMARGNGQMGPGTIVSNELIDFGGYMSGLSSQELEDVKDTEWEILKSLYYNLKQQLVLDYMDEDAMTCEDCYCFNRCIGKQFWMPYAYMPFWNPGNVQDCKYYAPDQQCGSLLKYHYSNKLPRWPRVEDIPGANADPDMNSAEYTVYEQTGLCPVDFQFQNLLNDIALSDELNSTTGVALQDFSSFSPLYMAMNDNYPTTPLSDLDWKWKATSDQSFLHVNITDISDASLICEVTLDRGAETWAWDDVIQFAEMEYTGDNGTDYTFEIRAHVVIDEATANFQWFTIQGSTSCFPLANCHFDDECEVNQLGIDILELFNAAQGSLSNGVLYSGNTNMDSQYVESLGIGVSNALGNPNTLNWHYAGNQTFVIAPSLNSTPYIQLQITEVLPTGYQFNDIANVDYFMNLNSEHEHYFSLEAYENGVHVATLLGSSMLDDGSNGLDPLPLGDCGLPQSLFCQGNEYEVAEDLENWFSEILSNGTNQDPLHSVAMTQLIANNINDLSAVVHGYPGTIEIDGTTYDTFEYPIANCGLTFYTPQSNTIDWYAISAIQDLIPMAPSNALSQFMGFSCTAIMLDGSEIDLFGEGCWPMLKCDVPCEDGILDFSEQFALENTVDENSVEKYLAYVEGIESHNLKYSLSPSDEDYILPISYEEFFDLGSKETVDMYLKKLESYDPLIDDAALIADIEYFAKEYGNRLDALKEYYSYLDIVVNYDVRAVAEGLIYIDPIIEEDFLAYSLADYVAGYKSYLGDYVDPTQEPLDLFAWSELYEADLDAYFKELYEEYVVAMKDWMTYQSIANTCSNYEDEKIYSIESFIELGYSKDIESIYLFEEFVDEIYESAACISTVKKIIEEEQQYAQRVDNKICQEMFLKYLSIIADYNQSAYGQQPGHAVSPVTTSFVEFEAMGFCECVNDYNHYLSTFIYLDRSDPTPPPVSLANFGDCGQQWETNPCDSAYTQYVVLVKAFNSYASAQGAYEIRRIVDYKLFISEELCLCLDEYEAYLQAIMDKAIKPDGEPISLLEFCNNEPPCDPDIGFIGDFEEPVYIEYINPCEDGQASLIAGNANLAYEQQITQMTQDFIQAYNNHCLLGLNENLRATFADKEYHYTLYYYDQAGNLIKTVPPAGIERKDITSIEDPEYQQILYDRHHKTQTVFTAHRLATTYVYNSLNQLVRQNLPDHDPMNIETYRLPSGLPENFASTEVQFVTENLGYLSGYVGERGYLMRTTDAGNTWQRIENVVGADMEEIAWLNDQRGTTVGAFGTILMTEDGGLTWQQQDTHGVSYDNLLDVIATNDTNKPFAAVGEHGRVVYYHEPTSEWKIANTTNILPTSTLTSITQLGSIYYITAVNIEGSLKYTTVYNSTDLLVWQTVDVRTNSINAMGYLDANPVLFCGNDGQVWMARGNSNLSGTPNDVSPYISIYTGRKDNIYGCFYSDLSHGLILAGTSPTTARLYSTQDAGSTWQLMNSGEYYKELVPFAEGSDNVIKVMAYTNGGNLHRITFNGGWGLVTTEAPSSGNAIKSLGVHHAYAASNQIATPAILSQGSQLFYTADAKASAINWTAISGGVSAKSIAIRYVGNSSLELGGLLVAETNGALHKLIKTGAAGSTVTLSTTNLTTETGYETVVADYESASARFFAVKANGDVKAWTMPNNGNISILASQSAPAGFGSLSACTVVGGKIYLTSSTGGIWEGTISGATISWTEKTRSLKPQPMRTIRNNGSEMLMAGEDGDVYEWNSTAMCFERISTETTKAINDIDWYASGYYMTADEGRLYKKSGSSDVASVINVAGNQGTNLLAVDVQDNKYYITGANGKIWFKANASESSSPQQLPQIGSGTPSTSASFIPGEQQAIAIGHNSQMFRLSGTNKYKVHELYGHPLEHVHFMNEGAGYAVGHHGTVRYTTNGGTSWSTQVVSNVSHVETIYGVSTYDPAHAYVVGDKGYFAKAENTSVTKGIPTTNTMPVNTILYDVVAYDSGIVMAVGSSEANQAVVTHSVNACYTFDISVLNNAPGLKAMTKLNHGNHAMAAGSQGKLAYLNFENNALAINAINSNIPSSINLNDIDFTDDITCFVTGNGGLFKSKMTMGSNASADFSISYTSGVAQGHYGVTSLSFSSLDPAENPLNGQSNLADFAMQTIAMNGPYTGFIGGVYSSTNTAANRLISDMSGKFSTLFYYDKLGRIVLSQNSKQQGNPDEENNIQYYSYTIYDALGRVSEAGQKEELTSGPQVESIFGALVGGAFNPLTIETIDPDELTPCAFNAWLNNGEANQINPSRTQVTRTQYDEVVAMNTQGTALETFTQNNLRKRVASVYYQEVYAPQLTIDNYDHATHYSYDIHGNVNVLLQDNPHADEYVEGGVADLVESQRFKMMEYDYDLISGNVHSVSYQKGKVDAWHHAYKYDADNRITEVYTSTHPDPMAILGATESDPVAIRELWDNDAKYFYYDHGPLARVEMGDNQVQGVDYAYTLQGWLKGINSNSLSAARDMGKDGYNDSANLNANFGQDVASFSLGYFAGDYSAIESTTNFLGATDGSTLQANRNDLWNGNIGMMQTSLIVHDAQGAEMRENLGMAYRYDQLNRLTAARGFTDFDAAANSWGTATSDGIYNNFFSYDANGNILTQQRWSRSTLVDDLTYHYAQNNGHITQNRLYNVNDAAAVTDEISSDMENQDPFTDGTGVNGNNNYIYSKIGELVSDELEEIQSIVWRVDSKIKQVNRTQGSDKMNLKFDYDAMGNRVAKHVLDQENTCIHSTYYVRDASGNVMAVYERDAGCESGAATYALTERHIYGSSRVGLNTAPVELMQESLPIVEDERVRVLGKKQYEIANHLGNVLTVVSDEKRVLDTNSDGLVDTYMASIISVTDYSPFGVTLDGRSWSNDEYRYGFQAQEQDSEMWSGSVTYKYRVEDPRLGRFFSVDPLYSNYPWNSYYAFSENRLIDFKELEGLEKVEYMVNNTCAETFRWDQVDRAAQEAFLRKHDIEGAFGVDYHPEDEQFANSSPNQIWRFYPQYCEGATGMLLVRYSDENALKNNNGTVFKLSGLIYNLAVFSSNIEGHSAPAFGSDLTEKQARVLTNSAIIVGGVLAVVVTAGAAAPLTALAASLEGFAIVSGTMSIAGGTAKMVLDLKGDFKNSDKIPTGYLGATIGATLTVTMEDGKTQHVLKGTVTIIEGVMTFNCPAASAEALAGNTLSVTNIVLDGDVKKAASDVTSE